VSDTTCDGFLDGRLRIEQPAHGYRAGADPVLMASAVPASEGDTVLELGCGVGTALFCLGWRVPGLTLCGLERDRRATDLARENAARNHMHAEIVTGDVAMMPAVLKARRFDVVMLNPPFFDRRHGTPADGPREAGRGEGEAGQADWIRAASRRLAPRGRMVLIQRTERLAGALAALDDGLGDVALRPVAARADSEAERFLLVARKGARGRLRLLPPLVLHGDSGDDSPAARGILREGLSLETAILTNR
jgi:tRNA1(Val) A37 N6-methylase TrmN6